MSLSRELTHELAFELTQMPRYADRSTQQRKHTPDVQGGLGLALALGHDVMVTRQQFCREGSVHTLHVPTPFSSQSSTKSQANSIDYTPLGQVTS